MKYSKYDLEEKKRGRDIKRHFSCDYSPSSTGRPPLSVLKTIRVLFNIPASSKPAVIFPARHKFDEKKKKKKKLYQ
jgi:hypothetical protein